MRILYLPDAAADVQETFEWYKRQRLGHGREFLAAVELADEALVRSQTAYKVVHRETRRSCCDASPISAPPWALDG